MTLLVMDWKMIRCGGLITWDLGVYPLTGGLVRVASVRLPSLDSLNHL